MVTMDTGRQNLYRADGPRRPDAEVLKESPIGRKYTFLVTLSGMALGTGAIVHRC